MRTEKFIDLFQLASGAAWPTYYVVTGVGCYELAGEAFVSCKLPKGAVSLPFPPQYSGREIRGVRGDGESAVICIDGGDLIVFDLAHNPFGGSVESHPEVRFVSSEQARAWTNELDAMPRL
jgi:hypothetical protein